MPSSPSWPSSSAEPGLPAELDGAAAVAQLAAGVWHLRTPAGADVVLKRGPGAADEAAGLRRLGAADDGPRVPAVVAATGDVLVTGWIEPGSRTDRSEVELGRRLAGLHRVPAGEWGGGSGWIGACRVEPEPAADPAAFYGRRLTGLAERAGLGPVVAPVVTRLAELIPPGPPAVVHGDLWWGNVLWGAGGQPWLIDPSVHGGHPEEDLAMLALFGPVPDRLLRAYDEVRPLAEGWAERVALWQLYPLLVHTVLFGGGYRASAEAVARRYA